MKGIEGKVTLSLESYEQIKEMLVQGKKDKQRLEKSVQEIRIAAKQLSFFLNHLSKGVTNFDNLVGSFNSESTECEIQKVKKNEYKIVLNEEEE